MTAVVEEPLKRCLRFQMSLRQRRSPIRDASFVGMTPVVKEPLKRCLRFQMSLRQRRSPLRDASFVGMTPACLSVSEAHLNTSYARSVTGNKDTMHIEWEAEPGRHRPRYR